MRMCWPLLQFSVSHEPSVIIADLLLNLYWYSIINNGYFIYVENCLLLSVLKTVY